MLSQATIFSHWKTKWKKHKQFKAFNEIKSFQCDMMIIVWRVLHGILMIRFCSSLKNQYTILFRLPWKLSSAYSVLNVKRKVNKKIKLIAFPRAIYTMTGERKNWLSLNMFNLFNDCSIYQIDSAMWHTFLLFIDVNGGDSNKNATEKMHNGHIKYRREKNLKHKSKK